MAFAAAKSWAVKILRQNLHNKKYQLAGLNGQSLPGLTYGATCKNENYIFLDLIVVIWYKASGFTGLFNTRDHVAITMVL